MVYPFWEIAYAARQYRNAICRALQITLDHSTSPLFTFFILCQLRAVNRYVGSDVRSNDRSQCSTHRVTVSCSRTSTPLRFCCHCNPEAAARTCQCVAERDSPNYPATVLRWTAQSAHSWDVHLWPRQT